MHYATIDNISKSFGARSLFQNITFHIEEGDKIALIARNGFGKSTLLQILTGRDTPDSGSVWVHKEVEVIFLNQEQHFDPARTIREEILSMQHPVAETVKQYEEYLESGKEDAALLEKLLVNMEELNAWNFENEVQQIFNNSFYFGNISLNCKVSKMFFF